MNLREQIRQLADVAKRVEECIRIEEEGEDSAEFEVEIEELRDCLELARAHIQRADGESKEFGSDAKVRQSLLRANHWLRLAARRPFAVGL